MQKSLKKIIFSICFVENRSFFSAGQFFCMRFCIFSFSAPGFSCRTAFFCAWRFHAKGSSCPLYRKKQPEVIRLLKQVLLISNASVAPGLRFISCCNRRTLFLICGRTRPCCNVLSGRLQEGLTSFRMP